ncbi:hypothetical protein SH661x_001060 [Planctomicrobium sp. SH661]|uniref:hypothetical protein n=1 Tax=Planctomicrobium sp. SH661 TaxID=3448124 RepID=UPI003F5C8866
MDANVTIFSKMVDAAKSGSESGEAFLREFLEAAACSMPTTILIAVSETILSCRRDEIKNDVRRN